jgi:hypothetical protein
MARRPTLSAASPGGIVRELNLAFFGAHLFAEGARTELPPAEQKARSNTVAFAARKLLEALDLPSEPRAFPVEE